MSAVPTARKNEISYCPRYNTRLYMIYSYLMFVKIKATVAHLLFCIVNRYVPVNRFILSIISELQPRRHKIDSI
ncbi:Clarin-2 [Trichinella pseudospiralis]